MLSYLGFYLLPHVFAIDLFLRYQKYSLSAARFFPKRANGTLFIGIGSIAKMRALIFYDENTSVIQLSYKVWIKFSGRQCLFSIENATILSLFNNL